MSAEARQVSGALLDDAREVGVERGIDLVLNVLFVRWITLQADDPKKGAQEWASLVRAGTDDQLLAEFTRLAIFRENEQLSASESQSFVGVLRRVVHSIDAHIRNRSRTKRRKLASDTFDATLEHLSLLGKQAGEADTPRELAELMVALTVRPEDRVLDPACGNATALVVAAHRVPGVSVSGFDINSRVARRASMRLMVNDISTGTGIGVWRGDSFLEYAPQEAEVVLLQPPWGVTFGKDQQERIRQLAIKYSPTFSTNGLPKGDMAWLLLALDALSLPRGRAAVVLTGSSVAPRCRYTQEHLLALNAVETIISFPAGVFEHTGIATVLWLLRAPRPNKAGDSVLMIDAQTLVESTGKGRVQVTSETQRIIESLVEANRCGAAIEIPPHIARPVALNEIDIRRGLHPNTYLEDAPEESTTHPVPERTLLTGVAVTNFKAFGSKTDVAFAPLTLLYGANSAGKSSIIQSLLLLKQSLQEQHLTTQGALVNVGGFDGILHGHRATELELSLAYGVLPAWIPMDGTPDPTLPRTVSWVFGRESSSHGVVLSMRLKFGEYELVLTKAPHDPESLRLALDKAAHVFVGIATGTLLYPFDARHYTQGDEVEQARRLRGRTSNARRALRNLEREGIDALTVRAPGLLAKTGPTELRVGGPSDRDQGIVNSYVNRTARIAVGISEEVEHLLNSLVWLGPLRSAPRRVYDRAETSSSPGDGNHVAIYLFDHASVVEEVNEWLRRLEIPYTLKVIPVTAGTAASLVGDLVAISLTDHRSGVTVTPADVGFGVSQVLPIVVELLSRRESIVAIEQPETHLHPRLQARLADLLIDTAQEGGRANQLLVETHSEHVMLRVQRRIREGTLEPSAVSVIYVDQDADGNATAKPLRLNDRGEFLDEWPDGFFDDRLEELFGEF